MAVRVRLPSDRDSETASIVPVVITPAPVVRLTPATSRHPTTEESTMVPPNRNWCSNETAQLSALKRRQTDKDPPSPLARVNVAVRVRLQSDRDFQTTSIVHLVDDRCHVFDPKAEAQYFHFQQQRACGGLIKPNEDQKFMFYQFFDEIEDNEHVFENTTRGMLTMLLEGWNCSVFACISTGADKAFALLGSEECPGVVSLMARQLYQRAPKLQSEGQTCDVAVAYLEVYNKVVQDLLCLDPAIGIAILSLAIHKVTEAGTVLELLLKRYNRTQHATDASCAHVIFESYVTLTENATSTSRETRVSMCSVHLAGSERAAAASRDTKDQMRKGTQLNLSLLALGNCIDARSKNGTQQVPYQDSKLTHILKDSLCGSGSALMIGTATAVKLSYADTRNTLEYALSGP
ncbi:kinesin-like protein KIF18B [Dermacentor silvarum]|uniref:kinesin-like protein KIF18B n=1 Tax=Dermacentor silvarum TaxID=543639 RepID=UPI00189AF8D4|nr:kinesin-like protein KIF18B [Dermacentor silvarum]